VGFSGFSGVSMIFGTAVMARRTCRQGRGVRGIPGVVADRGAGVARDGRWLGCGRYQRDSRHDAEGEREGEHDRGFERG
jgi:hypothetical protein